MAELQDGWSSPLPSIVDHLVRLIKRNGRWRRDGPCLRRLNRHWFHQLSHHVLEIRPYRDRNIRTDDVAKLRHFPQLTVLDATVLIGKNRKNVLDMMKILSTLQSLRHLELDAEVATMDIPDEALACLHSITSLTLRHGNENWICGEQLVKFTRWPLRELTIECAVLKLEVLLNALPPLRRLTIAQPIGDISLFDLDRLRSLDALELWYIGKHPNHLATLSSLVALNVPFDGIHLDWMHGLTRLKTLKLESLVDTDEFSCRSGLSSILHQLTCLEILGNARHLMRFAIVSLPNLKRLSLSRCIFPGRLMRNGGLQNLSSFVLRDCILEDKNDCISCLGNLERLHWESVTCDGSVVRLPLDGSILQSLGTLVINADSVDTWTNLSAMKKLQTLVFIGGTTDGWTLKGLNLTSPELLPSLRLFGVENIYMFCKECTYSKAFLMELEALYVDASYAIPKEHCGFVRDLAQSSGHLKIHCHHQVFVSFIQSCV